MRPELVVPVILLALVISCAPAQSATPASSPPPAASATDQRCALVEVAARIPAEVRTAIAAARRGDSPGSQAAMQRAASAASELQREVDAMSGRLAVTSRARFVSAEAFAQQADTLFLAAAPALPNADALLELDRGLAQVESLLAGVAAPCSS
ncbi:MAG: hypothetical protein E6J17_03470 [Chloroflexi bacterium]|nr:MAG: hypothetical protein E6J17_03470 [Chloroflexota bacterium]